VQPWELRFRGRGDRKALDRDQFIQKNCYACDEWGAKFFVNDRENPYEFDKDKPFHWIRGRHVGGRSITWGRQVYRWSDLDFEANAKDGIAVDWPIRYKDIEPWYDYVERFIGITGQAVGLPQLHVGQFLRPMQMRCAEQYVRDKLMEKWGGERVLTIGRCAVLTEKHNGRAACHYCGPCERGCVTHSYFTSIGSTLPAARRTKRLTLRPNSVVHSLIYDENQDRATGVRVIDAVTMQPLEFQARAVFLCASTLESTRILLNSKTNRFSTGLGNSSGQLGKNLMDHTFGAGARGTIPGMEDKTSYGRRPNGIYIARFRNVKEKHPDFLRGYGFQGGASRGDAPHPRNGVGAEFKAALLRKPELRPWRFSIGGWAECLPREDNVAELHPTLTDKWGVPALRINCTWGPN
jgi:choline dehydrogenase-like flavoprotein